MRRKKAARRAASGRTRGQRWLLRYGWLLPLGAVFVGGGILVLTYAFASIPLPKDVDYLNSSAEVFDRNGTMIGTFTDAERRFLVDTEELLDAKPYIGEAVIAAEDRDFYDHNGVSIDSIVRAAWKNLAGGKIVQGGSTITQQYVKNTVLTPEQTITRKLKEAILAIKLERQYSKDEILGFYLNTIYLGRGAYGIEAAARSYFDKHADELSLREAAYLASIIPSPEAVDPTRNPIGARDRRNVVLQAMAEEGFITQAKAAKASRGKVKAIRRVSGAPKTQTAAYFMEWLRRDVLAELGPQLYTGGLKIHTTLDLEMQRAAEDAVAATLTEPEEPQAALVSMTPGVQVRALVGGRAFENVKKARGFNFATDVGRQPGSAFKPFTLLTAIEEGISTSSRFSGRSPMTIPDVECYTDGGPWEVDNYGGSSYGTLDLKQATANSVNTVYAQLIAEVGPEKVTKLLEDMEFSGGGEIGVDCAHSLGGSIDATPLEMARAYTAVNAGGVLPEVAAVTYIEDSHGNCLIEYVQDKERDCETEAKADGERVVEENSAHVLTQALETVVTSGTAADAVSLPRPAAGKTGTTQDNKDAWFAGYVPQLTTVVWMGYPLEQVKGDPDGVVPLMSYCLDPVECRPVKGIEVTGGSFPAQMWNAYMSVATAEMEVVDFPIPTDLPDEVINTAPPVSTATAPPTDEATPDPEPTETDIEVTPPPPTPPPPPPTPPPGPTIIPASEEPTPQPDEGTSEQRAFGPVGRADRLPFAYVYRRSGR